MTGICGRGALTRDAGAPASLAWTPCSCSSRASPRQTVVFREQFLGVLGHDLRSPLQAISVNRISVSADRMARMSNDLLDFTCTRLGGGYPEEGTRFRLCLPRFEKPDMLSR
ncbi:putative histidine kinase [Myxococcus xanthus DK 1622]|uniref:histidine kinase n=1 Tax=Myxococcus xanthus (strain DK1622) TaxID=246197 RepID=Q1DE61_MYXXD|nr:MULTISPECIES: histidine kinase [Myxococcus]ABF87065.1 putative histidine kinase [Myxococcus xanthus DK 1622]QZZ48332.1 hypothetical protein MyxoNM_03920 [Myxococcus xanthus]SDW53043.1 hypothetical protein SAMN05444383_102523 [Myxococcus xanthus]